MVRDNGFCFPYLGGNKIQNLGTWAENPPGMNNGVYIYNKLILGCVYWSSQEEKL